MPMMMQFLEEACKIRYESAKNMLTILPIMQIPVIIAGMFLSKAIKNETKPLWVSTLLMFALMVSLPILDLEGETIGMIV